MVAPHIRSLETPALIYDDDCLLDSVGRAMAIAEAAKCRLLYSPKACSLPSVIRTLTNHVDGFACSSLYEGKLLRKMLGQNVELHLNTPGLDMTDIDAMARNFDTVVLNSLTQLQRLDYANAENISIGIRINPLLSFVPDARYDPCRKNSKLGIPVKQAKRVFEDAPEMFEKIDGLHLHNNCESISSGEMVRTVETIQNNLSAILDRVRWINLGGGYLFDQIDNPDAVVRCILELQKRFSIDVFLEPGAALVRQAGSLVSRVVDIFEGEDTKIAILDTTVNHMPEVLEYQFAPDVLERAEGAAHCYLLAGSSCLAGDEFGVCEFAHPLEIGSSVTFLNVGAYTYSRANMFNGIPLPHVYQKTTSGGFVMVRRATFDDFLGQNPDVRF